MYNKTMIILQGIIPDLKNTTPTPTALPETAQKIADGVTRTGSTWDSFIQLVGLSLLLIVILIAAYYTTKFVGGIKVGQLKNSNFKVIDAYRISPNKVIQIVKIANKYMVIAVGKDSINYITELEEAEIFFRDENTGEKLIFKQILEKLRNNHK